MKRMLDFSEMSNKVDKNLPEGERFIKLCDILLEEFAKMKGKDLAPYLTEFVLDLGLLPCQRITIRFPFAANVFNPNFCDMETDGTEIPSDNVKGQDKV